MSWLLTITLPISFTGNGCTQCAESERWQHISIIDELHSSYASRDWICSVEYGALNAAVVTTSRCRSLQPEKPPLPSYQEVREELGEKLHNLNRKQKRKMIKNKRNKLRKSMVGVKEEGEEPEDTEEVESEEHKKQARLWEERNRMMDVCALQRLDV